MSAGPLFEKPTAKRVKKFVPIDAEALFAGLARRFTPPAYALLAQVSNATGWGRSRWADAIAMSLWPSRGLDLNGFEIKSHRGDWRRELKNPAKADEIADYCDFWWIVSGPGVVDLATDPIPPTWGLLELDGRDLSMVRHAERHANAVPLDKPMCAAILRRASEHMVPKASVNGLIEAAREEGRERGANKFDLEVATRETERVRGEVAAFEKASGVRIQDWGGGNVGRLFKLAQSLDVSLSTARLDRVAVELREAVAALERASKEARDGASATPEPR